MIRCICWFCYIVFQEHTSRYLSACCRQPAGLGEVDHTIGQRLGGPENWFNADAGQRSTEGLWQLLVRREQLARH